MTKRGGASPGERTLSITAADGFPLGARLFEPEGKAWAAVVVHGATAVPQRYYERFARYLASEGVRALTYDYRGVGLSRPASLRGMRATMTEWGRFDAPAALAHVRGLSPRLPVIGIGHSFGGQILGLSDELHAIDGALLVASQLGYVGHWNAPARWGLNAIFHGLVPAVTGTLGYMPGALGLGEDLPKGVVREWARWCTSPGYLLDHHGDAAERFARFDKPTLLMSFTDDAYAPRRAVEALASALSRAKLRRRVVKPREVGTGPLGHFGFFRPLGSSLWPEALSFLVDCAGGEAKRAA